MKNNNLTTGQIIKKNIWRHIYRFFPWMQEHFLKWHLVWHEKGRQPYHIGWLAPGKTLEELESKIISYCYNDLQLHLRKYKFEQLIPILQTKHFHMHTKLFRRQKIVDFSSIIFSKTFSSPFFDLRSLHEQL